MASCNLAYQKIIKEHWHGNDEKCQKKVAESFIEIGHFIEIEFFRVRNSSAKSLYDDAPDRPKGLSNSQIESCKVIIL